MDVHPGTLKKITKVSGKRCRRHCGRQRSTATITRRKFLFLIDGFWSLGIWPLYLPLSPALYIHIYVYIYIHMHVYTDAVYPGDDYYNNNVCGISIIFSPTNRRRRAITRKAVIWSTPTWTTVRCTVTVRSITNKRLELNTWPRPDFLLLLPFLPHFSTIKKKKLKTRLSQNRTLSSSSIA